MTRAALACAALLALAGCSREPRPTVLPSGPPDLLLITLDTFRADRAGCWGHPGGLTPSIDRILRRAWIARNAYAPAPLTAPSHATLLTAREPYRHGVRENGLFPLDDSQVTLAEHLAARGFRTAAFIAAFPLESRFGFAQGFATFDETLGPDPGSGAYYAERPASEVTDAALAWIATVPSGERAFVWTHYFDAHHPYRPPRALKSLPARDDYEREIRALDAEVGRLWIGMQDAGRRPWVAMVSDHGEGLGEHRELSHGILLHEETMRGLLGLAPPPGGDPSGRVHGIRDPVARYADVAPTLLDALGEDPMADVDGTSLLAGDPPEGVYGETYYPMLHYRWSPLLSWRNDRWAYIDAPSPRLYDRIRDPGESQDVAAANPDVVGALQRRLADVESPPAADAAAPVDEAAREKLAALGYVATPGGSRYDAAKDPHELVDAVNSLFRGMSLVREGNPRAALPILQKAYREDPGNATVVLHLANCLRELGEPGTAMTYYRRAIDLEPRAGEAWAHLALLRFEGGDSSAALRLLEDGTRVNPSSFALRMTAGDLSLETGRIEDARRHYEAAAEAEPRRPEPWAALALLADGRGDSAEARRLREQAATRAPVSRAPDGP